MRLKPIKWQIIEGKPRDGSLKGFKIFGEIDGILDGEVKGFYITNIVPYAKDRIHKDRVYLCRSVPYRYGRRNHILLFETIAQAKKKAQEIGTKLVIDKYFIKGVRLSRKVMVEKQINNKRKWAYS